MKILCLVSEKIFVYGSNVAYEYRIGSKSSSCSLQTVSVSTQTCASSGAVSELTKEGHNHKGSCDLYINQTSVIKDKSNSCYGVTTHACQKCCLCETVKDIAANVCAEIRSCRTIVDCKSVNEEDPNTNDSTAKKPMHAVTHENEEGILKKKIEWVNSFNSFDTDFKTKLHKELKFNSLYTAEQILHNDEYSTSAAKCVQKWVSRHPSPESIVERSLNMINKSEHLHLKCEEEFKVDHVDGFLVMGDRTRSDVFQTKTNVEDHRKPIVTKNTKNVTHLALNVPVIESDVVPLGNSCNRCVCYGSAGCKGNSAFEFKSDSKIKYDRTMYCCGSESRYGFGRISMYDVSSPELICEEEWIASQSCSVISESTDYVTCEDTCPVVKMTGVAVSSALQKEGQNANWLESNTSNPNNKVRCSRSSSSSSSSSSVPASESADSFLGLSEEYKYSDEEGGVVLLERRFLVPTIW
jgi:hypothetical protein